MADFVEAEQDLFRPNYGGVIWTPRLNALLERTGVILTPVAYQETEPMQVTQENTIFYINQVADELDCVAVKYDQDPEDIWTWYFREKFTTVPFERVVGAVSVWASVTTTLYPMKHVVEQYEAFQASDLDTVPDWLQ